MSVGWFARYAKHLLGTAVDGGRAWGCKVKTSLPSSRRVVCVFDGREKGSHVFRLECVNYAHMSTKYYITTPAEFPLLADAGPHSVDCAP